MRQNRTTSKATVPLDPEHTDLFGPVKIRPVCGAIYFISLIYIYSHWVVVYPMRQKSDVKAVHLHLEKWLRIKRIDAFEQLEVI